MSLKQEDPSNEQHYSPESVCIGEGLRRLANALHALGGLNSEEIKSSVDRLEKESPLAQKACSEIFIGEEDSALTTRARGNLGDTTFFIKGSGLLISTGAGSTGWFRAASQHLFHGELLWLRTDRHGEFVSREPYGDVDSLTRATLHGRLDPGQRFEIISSSNHHPIVSVDSLVTEHFPRDQRAVIQISPSPLKVVVPRTLHAPAAE